MKSLVTRLLRSILSSEILDKGYVQLEIGILHLLSLFFFFVFHMPFMKKSVFALMHFFGKDLLLHGILNCSKTWSGNLVFLCHRSSINLMALRLVLLFLFEVIADVDCKLSSLMKSNGFSDRMGLSL
ncbi:hypothetical protein ACFE04_006147 [Oxalis oulophora]